MIGLAIGVGAAAFGAGVVFGVVSERMRRWRRLTNTEARPGFLPHRLP